MIFFSVKHTTYNMNLMKLYPFSDSVSSQWHNPLRPTYPSRLMGGDIMLELVFLMLAVHEQYISQNCNRFGTFKSRFFTGMETGW